MKVPIDLTVLRLHRASPETIDEVFALLGSLVWSRDSSTWYHVDFIDVADYRAIMRLSVATQEVMDVRYFQSILTGYTKQTTLCRLQCEGWSNPN